MIVIAELINATRKKVRQAVIDRDEDLIKDLAVSQAEAGADYIDVNVGTGKGTESDEIDNMKWAVNLVKESVDTPLSVDSANNKVLRAGLEELDPDEDCFINSVTAENERLEPTLALVKEFGTNVIALAMGDDGIKVEVEERVQAADTIMEKVRAMDIPEEQIYYDPLVMPLGTDPRNPSLTLDTGRSIHEKYPETKLTMGLSNVSHGLPNRSLLNRVFLTLAMSAGFHSAIIDPTDRDMMDTVHAAAALLGNDDFCMNYIQYMK